MLGNHIHYKDSLPAWQVARYNIDKPLQEWRTRYVQKVPTFGTQTWKSKTGLGIPVNVYEARGNTTIPVVQGC